MENMLFISFGRKPGVKNLTTAEISCTILVLVKCLNNKKNDTESHPSPSRMRNTPHTQMRCKSHHLNKSPSQDVDELFLFTTKGGSIIYTIAGYKRYSG